MAYKKTIPEKCFDSINILFMILIIIITLYPFVFILMASISSASELVGHMGIMIWPKGFSLEAYRLVFKNPNILIGYKNTIVILFVGTTVNIIMTSLGAYVLSRNNFAIKKVMLIMIIFTMYFSGGLIPRYLLIYNTLGLGDKLLALIIPGAISTWNLIIMRTYFMSIPESLIESAKIDGANDFVILLRVILPVSMPIIAVMILFYGVSHWNSWFDAMIFLRTRKLYPLQLILREILISNSMNDMMMESGDLDKEALGESLKYGSIIVATLPILLIYPFIQKYFVKGVMIGAIKG
jgi:putative aldouronate transport system permease protein